MDSAKQGPYAPPEHVARVLGKVRESGVRKLNTDFLGQLGIHAAMAPRTVRALEFLGFTDKSGNALPLLNEYYAAGSDEDAKAILANAIFAAYEIIIRAARPEAASREQIENAFRVLEPAGQRNRMVTLFLGLCRMAGIDVKDPPSKRPGTSVKPKIPKGNNRGSASSNGTANLLPGMTSISGTQPEHQANNGIRTKIDPMLQSILDKVATVNTIDDLDEWYALFRAGFVLVGKLHSTKSEAQAAT